MSSTDENLREHDAKVAPGWHKYQAELNEAWEVYREKCKKIDQQDIIIDGPDTN